MHCHHLLFDLQETSSVENICSAQIVSLANVQHLHKNPEPIVLSSIQKLFPLRVFEVGCGVGLQPLLIHAEAVG